MKAYFADRRVVFFWLGYVYFFILIVISVQFFFIPCKEDTAPLIVPLNISATNLFSSISFPSTKSFVSKMSPNCTFLLGGFKVFLKRVLIDQVVSMTWAVLGHVPQ